MEKSNRQKEKKKMLLSTAAEKLKHECARIFGLKRNIVFLILFGLVGVFFVYSGGIGYKDFLKEKAFFRAEEKSKVNSYTTYSQYGECGFRVLYEPMPLSLFFTNSGVFENLFAHVDMTGSLKVNSPYKGRNLFLKKGFFKDFAGLFFLFGSLFMVYMGMASYTSERFFFRFGNLILRLILLDSFFLCLAIILHKVPELMGIKFSPAESKVFSDFTLYLLCFLGFFYAAGLFIRVLSRKRENTLIYILIFWFFSVFIIPEIMTIFLQNKSRILQANETYHIMKPEEARGVVREYESVMQIYPTGFFNFLSGELSTRGYSGYLDLVRYTLALQHNFVRYYLEKRYESNDKKIIPFVKGEENIFKSSVRLPASFSVGRGLTLAYTILLLLVSYMVLRRRLNGRPTIKNPQYKFRKGGTFFVLCENNQFKNDLFNYYRAEKDTVCIDRVGAEDIDAGVGLVPMVGYFCKITGVDEKKAVRNLFMLGIEDPKSPQWKKERLPEDVVQKIYCAVSLAGEHRVIVVNDFLKGKSWEMERKFLNLVTRLNNAGKIVVYLSTEIFSTSLPFEGDIKIDSYKSFKIDPQAVSLR
jgi:hypothetical protein